jgi:hypothetical protein
LRGAKSTRDVRHWEPRSACLSLLFRLCLPPWSAVVLPSAHLPLAGSMASGDWLHRLQAVALSRERTPASLPRYPRPPGLDRPTHFCGHAFCRPRPCCAARDAKPFGPNFFQPFSVRSDVVCLRATNGTVPRRREGPFVYLGEPGGTMVLFDYRSDDFNVIRLPSSDFMTEWATPNRTPGHFSAFRRVTWTCPRSRGFGSQNTDTG